MTINRKATSEVKNDKGEEKTFKDCNEMRKRIRRILRKIRVGISSRMGKAQVWGSQAECQVSAVASISLASSISPGAAVLGGLSMACFFPAPGGHQQGSMSWRTRRLVGNMLKNSKSERKSGKALMEIKMACWWNSEEGHSCENIQAKTRFFLNACCPFQCLNMDFV